jgi:hypothetical protein
LASSGVDCTGGDDLIKTIGPWSLGTFTGDPISDVINFLKESSTYYLQSGNASIFDYSVNFDSTVLNVTYTYSGDGSTYYTTTTTSGTSLNWFLPGFPFSFGTKIAKAYLIQEQDTSVASTGVGNLTTTHVGTIFVPGSTFGFTWTKPSELGDSTPNQMPYHDVFDGWLHASNGKHIVQGFCIATTFAHDVSDGDSEPPAWAPHLICDGVPFGAALAAALGTSIDNIQTLLLDVPLGRIKQLS